MKFCYVIVDGFGFAQFQRQKPPFMTSLAEETAVREVTTLLAYSSGIYPSIWSGCYPEEHMIWGEFYFDPHAGGGTTDFLRFLPSPYLQRALKYVALQGLARLGVRPKDFFGLPPAIERYFRRVESRYKELPPARSSGLTMINDLMDAAGHPWRFVYYPNFYQGKVSAADIAGWTAHDSFFLYIPDADGMGHHAGPGSQSYRDLILRLDHAVESLVNHLRTANPGVEVYVLSDHGMNEVTATVDVWGHLTRTGLRLGVDYVAFFNSTIASFWFLRPGAEARIRAALTHLERGHVLEEAELARYHLRFSDDRYGQALFVVEPGIEILPNFMSLARKPSRGMHGYPVEDPDTAALLIGPQHKIAHVRDVTDVFSVVRDNWQQAEEARSGHKNAIPTS